MRTLKELKNAYQRCPKTLKAIEKAIKENGEEANAIVVKGKCSTAHNSACYKQAIKEGFNEFVIYPGASRQRWTQEYINIIVKIK